jgi:predicted nuclease of predicted toxin-antitoxin system
MKIKLDENIPIRLLDTLTALGHSVDTVPTEGLTGHADQIIWEASQTAGFFLITQDLDFSNIRRYQPGTHHGLLIVRLRVPGRQALFQRTEYIFQTERVEDWAGCLVILTDNKIRIRKG